MKDKMYTGYCLAQNSKGFWLAKIARIRGFDYTLPPFAGPYTTAGDAIKELMRRGMACLAIRVEGPEHTWVVAKRVGSGKWQILTETNGIFMSFEEAFAKGPTKGMRAEDIPLIHPSDLEQ